jgi:hypothetical protein
MGHAFLATTRHAAGDPFRYHGGFRNSPDAKKLNDKQLDSVIKSLRDKSGFLEIGFDENGFLTLGDRSKFAGGSTTARELLSATVETNSAVDLEAHNNSPVVAFARLAKPTIYHSRATGRSIDVYPIEIDFSDFSKLRGDKKVLAAFDIGFVILHELGHAVLGLRDALNESQGVGECEEYINRIRRELNLPERQNYIARTHLSLISTSLKSIQRAELFFTDSGDKARKLALSWEAPLVGPVKQYLPSIAKGREN